MLWTRSRVWGRIAPFPFVPSSDGNATSASASAVSAFLDEIVEHVARQATNREREQWWSARVHEAQPSEQAPEYVDLDAPPADATMLIGYYRDRDHLAWIESTRLYNMRLGKRRGSVELTSAQASARTLVLWSLNSDEIRLWRLATRLEILDAEEMHTLRYPSRPSERYLCRVLDDELARPSFIDRSLLVGLAGAPVGAPIATTWAALLDAAIAR